MPTTNIDEIKNRLAAALDIYEILDLLGLTERELLDYLDEPIEEQRQQIISALS